MTGIGSAEWIARYSLSSREACRWAQLELAREEERHFSLEGDLAMPSVPFCEAFPERYLQIGISEADLVATAVGLAKAGKVPFVNSFASFTVMRACEQVVLDVALSRANVKLMGYYAGISGGLAAATHSCLEDFAVLRALPGMTVLSPADAVETWKAVHAAFTWEGPVYLRLGRAETPQVYHHDYRFEIGKAVQLRDGHDVTLMATGILVVSETLRAAELLHAEGISARVLNHHTVKPLDRMAVIAAAAETGAVVTVEEHNVIGGLGGAVAEVLQQTRPVPCVRVGIADTFCDELAPHEEMLRIYGLDAESIMAAAKQALANSA